MSVITLFTRKAPTLNGIEFDAVIEDTYESSVDYTGYTLENGAQVIDHGIIMPSRWRMTGIVSNNPLNLNVTDFTLGALSNFTPGSTAGLIAGLSAGFLAGSDDTRSSSTLIFLNQLMVKKLPFDIDAGDIQLANMAITDLRRTKDTGNENGLVFHIELQELPTLDTIDSIGQPKQDQLRDDDPAKNQVAAFLDKGEQQLKDVGSSINNAINGLLL